MSVCLHLPQKYTENIRVFCTTDCLTVCITSAAHVATCNQHEIDICGMCRHKLNTRQIWKIFSLTCFQVVNNCNNKPSV